MDQASALAAAQVVVDFSTPQASVQLAQVCAARGEIALVLSGARVEVVEIEG